jgi:uncharacterized lipoprotein YehR (DUF1307 family)
MKIFNMKLLVVFALLYCIVLTACPKDTAVRKAARASYELAGLTHDAIAATERAYNDHILSQGAKRSNRSVAGHNRSWGRKV